jgi:hypothetical protein
MVPKEMSRQTIVAAAVYLYDSFIKLFWVVEEWIMG